MPSTMQKSPGAPPRSFETDVKIVAKSLRTSLSALMTSAGLNPQDPKALSQGWGVNKTLSWRISKIIQTDDPYLALQQLPGREGVEILLRKGSAAGLDTSYLKATQDAVADFDRLIEDHCGDRATFDIMGIDSSPAAAQLRDETHRKQLFQGASYVWGVQARAYLNMRFVAPSLPGKVDVACITGLLDFRRLRENVPWVMSRRILHHDDGSPSQLAEIDPLDPSAVGQIMPLMPQFCSQPTPQLHVIRNRSSATIELAPSAVGKAGMLTYMAGAIERSLTNVKSEHDQDFAMWALSNTPAELLIYDVYLHSSLTQAIPPRLIMTSLLGSLPPGVADFERFQLPLNDPLIDLGSAVPPPVTPEVPRYNEMLQVVFNRTGWSPADFRGFRVKMAYPPVPVGLVMSYPLL